MSKEMNEAGWEDVKKDASESTVIKTIQTTSRVVKDATTTTLDTTVSILEGAAKAGDRFFEHDATRKVVGAVDSVANRIAETKVVKVIVNETIGKERHLYMDKMYSFRSELKREKERKENDELMGQEAGIADTTSTGVIPFTGQPTSVLQSRLEKLQEALSGSSNPILKAGSVFVKGAASVVGAVENYVFSSTPKAEVLTKFKERDADFSLEKFMYQVEHYLMPTVLNAYYKKDIETLQNTTSSKCFKAYLMPRIQQRKGMYYDTRVLDIRDVTLLNAQMVGDEPMLMVGGIYQYIHCVKDMKTHKILEGKEDDIRTESHFWVLSMDAESKDWEVQELAFGGSLRF